jgi:trehalose 6-phosphate synthase/phosphatase
VRGPRRWVGWPGAVVAPEAHDEITTTLGAQGLHPVFLDEQETEDFYGRICNDTLWPLFHYFVDRLRITEAAWERYVRVNRRFAERAAQIADVRSRVWVHDFHLMLVPSMLRAARPDLTVGFFLHVPFPSSEVYRVLPSREELLRGVLGADYVGFQTGDDARHFRSSCLRVLGLDSNPDEIDVGGRRVGIGIHPIGIDTSGFRDTLASPEARAALDELEDRVGHRTLVLGVERLDYSKGIPQKLRAFERYLERDPARAATTTMLQVLVPSRLESPEYQAQRDEIELLVSGINGRFGQPGITPVEYLHRSISHAELVALYRRADVLLVTSLRDGMNLVAQEFAYCQSVAGPPRRWNGALLLSEFAGAARVLPGAILVNPWDVGGIATRLEEAVALPPPERRRRLESMATRVAGLDTRRWAATFLQQLDASARRRRRGPAVTRLVSTTRARLVERFARARQRTLLLDYDGTLHEIVEHPELAAPTPEILTLLRDLAGLERTQVHVVSGRDRATVERWFGELPIWLCAEHGYVARPPGGAWTPLLEVDLLWLPRITRMLRAATDEVPGTFVERKPAGVAWHFRQAEPEYGTWRSNELLSQLDQALTGLPAEVISGRRVVEVRARGVNKGLYVGRVFEQPLPRRHVALAIGDDRTDQDMFAAMPEGAVSLHVGGGRTIGPARHQHVLDDPADVRALLGELLAAARAQVLAPGRAASPDAGE